MKKEKEMTLGELCRAIINETSKGILDLIYSISEEKKPKRARGKKGRYLADDKSTEFTNEAWVGGKAPKKKRRKK